MELRTILFDFDGTLANTLPLVVHALHEIFRKFDGRELDKRQIIDMFGPADQKIIEKNFHHRDKVAAAVELYFHLYETEHNAYIQDDPAINRMLKILKEQGRRVGVITGKSRRAYLISEQALGFAGQFESVITGDDVKRPKPDPSGILKMMDQFGADAATTIYIGDSNSDILAGKAAGIHTAAVQWLPVTQSSTYPAGPEFFWTNVDQFLALLRQQDK